MSPVKPARRDIAPGGVDDFYSTQQPGKLKTMSMTNDEAILF